MPRLIVCQDAQNYRVIEFTTSITIGRDDTNDIILDSPLASRQHASIVQRENGDYVLYDHESTNGVWMDNRKVNAIRLGQGMSFRILNYFFTLIDEQDLNRLSQVFSAESSLPEEKARPIDSETILFDPEQEFAALHDETSAAPRQKEAPDLRQLSDFFMELQRMDEEGGLGERLLAGAAALLRAERGFLALLGDKDELAYAQTHHFDPQKESRGIRQDIVRQVMESGASVISSTTAAKGGDRLRGKNSRNRAILCAPLLRQGRPIGCLYFDHGDTDFFQPADQCVIEIIALHGAALLDNLIGRKRVHQERESLKARLAAKDETIVRSEKMLKLYEDIRTIAPINVPVFISGEAGSGKEHVAAALHSFSRRKGAYIPLNCSAIPEGIFESELFGSRKGAFHEAIDKPGKLELAEGGTLFLDEVADMSLVLQPKLLRFLENGEVSRLGDTRTKKLNVRVVTATNRDVPAMIANQTFRDDLFQRLSCFTLKVPPLRERVEDIEPLCCYFLKKFSAEYNWKEPRMTDNALQMLIQYQWPGNIRQLRNVLLRLAVQSQGKLITDKEILALVEEFGGLQPVKTEVFPTLEEMEKDHLKAALERAKGNISDAAVLVGIARSTLYQKMKKYDISD